MTTMLGVGAVLLGLLCLASEGAAQPASDWVRLSEHAAFCQRDTAEGVVFQDKLWLSNGYCPNECPGVVKNLIRDLWNSTDGVTWTKVLDATPYDGYAEMCVYEGKMWAIKSSVWNSTDGVTWTKVLDKTPFGTRGYGEIVVHDGKMWQLGSGSDVWWTKDGVTWTCATKEAPYGSRYGSAVAVFGGKLWLLAGAVNAESNPPEKHYPKFTTYNDVWCSVDGANWTRVLEHAPFEARQWVVAQVYAGKIWFIGGFSNRRSVNFDDVWYTSDGTNWTQLVTKTKFSPRHEATLYDYQGSLWLVAGNMWPLMNDVWRLEPPMK